MNKSLAITLTLIVIAILAFGVTALTRQTPQEDSLAPQITQTNEGSTDTPESTDTDVVAGQTIVFDGSAYTPQDVTIKKGEAVTFRNDSTTSIWPASNDHPSHTELSGFDALRSLKKGESYSYTFDAVGSWDYHDHNNPSFSGTITVTE